MKKKLDPADYVIAAGVIVPLAYDVYAWRKDNKTVSVRFGEFLDDPKSRAVAVVAWSVLTLHLFMKLPLPMQRTLKQLIVGGTLRSLSEKEGI